MKKSILLDIIRSFDRKEYKYIQKWLRSPIHNKREDVALLFDLISQAHTVEIQKERIYVLLYPQTKYEDARMRQVMYFLQKELEQYLIYQAVSTDLLFPARTLLNVYQKKKLNRPFERTFTKAQHQLEKYPYRNRHHLQMQHLFLQEEYNYKSRSGRFQEFNLQLLSETLERHFLAEKIRLACMELSHQRLYKTSYKQELLTFVLTYVEDRAWLDHPAISLYYYAYKALTESDKIWFDRLLEDMKKWKNQFPIDERREILFLALNFCIAKINEGDNSYYQQTLDFYRTGIEEGTLLINGQVSRFTFINIVLAAIHEKEFVWAEKLMTEYDHLLEKQFRESTINLSYIRLYYDRKEYKKAMQLINETVFDDIIMGLFARGIMAKIYYEIDQVDVLETYLDSLLTYLRRKDLMVYHQQVYKAFALSLKKILRLAPNDKKAKERLYQEILGKDKIVERAWLLKCLK